jgi:hypothetical protein
MTKLPPRQTRYFVAGGAMRLSTPSYVERPADGELYERVQAGDFCYVLTPRQMGKSSLMVRTNRRLKQGDTHTVIIDLTEIGTVSIDKWYQGLLTKLQRDLELYVDVKSWWQDHANLGAPQRFHQFLADIILPVVAGNIVIFIDEIDSTLNLDFRDDFFATIRAVYNGRSHNPELDRVTFVLLGVASPSELIEDRLRTPFNIGHEINLQEFNQQDAQVLLQGLTAIYAEQGQAIFDRIFYWTSGHPYLTQQLCVHVTENNSQNWDDDDIDRLVSRLFIQDEARGETNIQFVSDRVLKSPQRASLLKLYEEVYKGKTIADNKQSTIQSQLLLSGLVKIDDGRLIVRNQIYTQAFNQDWINKETAFNWTLWISGVAVAIAILAVGLLIWETIVLPDRAESFANDFYEAEEAPTRTAAIVKLLNLNPRIGPDYVYEHQVRELFYYPLISWYGQSTILDHNHFNNPEDFLDLIDTTYIALADVDNTDDTTRMLRKMDDNLGIWPDENKDLTSLQIEIQAWLGARSELKKGNLETAEIKYKQAIEENPENPATRFELARVYILIARQEEPEADYDLALNELDKVVEITYRLEPETVEVIVTPSPVSTFPPTLASTTPDLILTSTSPTIGPLGIQPTDVTSEDFTSTSADSASSTATPLPPTPNPEPVIPVFITFQERVVAVRNLLLTYPEVQLYAQLVDETSYSNLRINNFIPALSTVQTETCVCPPQEGIVSDTAVDGSRVVVVGGTCIEPEPCSDANDLDISSYDRNLFTSEMETDLASLGAVYALLDIRPKGKTWDPPIQITVVMNKPAPRDNFEISIFSWDSNGNRWVVTATAIADLKGDLVAYGEISHT